MPTSGNLKCGDFLFCITTPHPLPPNCPISLKHYMNSYMKYRPSYNSLLWSWRPNNLCQWWNTCKEAPETKLWKSKKIGILRKNGKNPKWNHWKAHNSVLSGRVGMYALKQSVKYWTHLLLCSSRKYLYPPRREVRIRTLYSNSVLSVVDRIE